jgi:hypothetical protein
VRGDDAAIKKQLLGYWKSPRHGYLYKANGIQYMLPRPPSTSTSHWDVRNGIYYEMDGGRTYSYRIISLTDKEFRYAPLEGDPHPFTLIRSTAEENKP